MSEQNIPTINLEEWTKNLIAYQVETDTDFEKFLNENWLELLAE
jgi:hypothetical protein